MKIVRVKSHFYRYTRMGYSICEGARPVKLADFPGEFFAWKDERNHWFVYEAVTGLLVVGNMDIFKTKKEALAAANAYLNAYIQKGYSIQEYVETGADTGYLSPAFKVVEEN